MILLILREQELGYKGRDSRNFDKLCTQEQSKPRSDRYSVVLESAQDLRDFVSSCFDPLFVLLLRGGGEIGIVVAEESEEDEELMVQDADDVFGEAGAEPGPELLFEVVHEAEDVM